MEEKDLKEMLEIVQQIGESTSQMVKFGFDLESPIISKLFVAESDLVQKIEDIFFKGHEVVSHYRWETGIIEVDGKEFHLKTADDVVEYWKRFYKNN